MTSSPQFRWIFHDNSKNKNRRILLSFSHSIQSIAHLSWKWGRNWGGWGLLVVPWDNSNTFEEKKIGKKIVLKMLEHFWTEFFLSNFFFFKSVQIYKKDPESAFQKNLKIKFQIFPIFIYRDMVIFGHICTQIFDDFFSITWKIKIGEFFYYFFHSIQHIPHYT